MEKEKVQTIKIFFKTLQKLRMVHALTGETQQNILDRLLAEELEKLQGKETKQSENP